MDVTTLYGFTGGSDGASPNAALMLPGDTLYGTTISSNEMVFSVKIDGSGFQTLHAFSNRLPSPTGPYGTANLGGEFGQGTLFSLNGWKRVQDPSYLCRVARSHQL